MVRLATKAIPLVVLNHIISVSGETKGFYRMEAIDLSATKELPLDADVDELPNASVKVAAVGLGGMQLDTPGYSKKL
jgi:hypothetical protein